MTMMVIMHFFSCYTAIFCLISEIGARLVVLSDVGCKV